jgi:dehydrogenase/reductase SDR family protein 12
MNKMPDRRRTRSKTVRLVEQRRVSMSRGAVFAYTADFSNIEDWDPGVLSSSKITDGPVAVGTRYELEVKFGLGTTSMVYEITAYEPEDRVVLVGNGSKLHAVDEIRFSTQDDMTVIDYTADLTFLNFFRYVAPVLGPALDRVGKRALDGLVEALRR